MSAYQEQYQWAKEQPEAFWRKQAQQIDWFQPPQTILANDEHGIERWFPDGVLLVSTRLSLRARPWRSHCADLRLARDGQKAALQLLGTA